MSASPPSSAPSDARPSHNIPQPLTRFIGREREIAEGQRRLSQSRLLTITGPGGAGKTRLAREIASLVAQTAASPVWWVELAPIADQNLVPHAVASVLGLREVQGQEWTDAIIAEVKRRPLLLVLDGCEHLIEACARLVGTLLRACPQLRCLATSQEPLGIIGEAVLSTPPLTLPNPRHASDLTTLSRSEAVQLFVDRSATVAPGFVLDAHNGPIIAQICTRLDGIPLAIELAAARVRLLTVEQIAARLDDRFRLLTQGSRTALPRHQTLRAAIEWSYSLLSLQEQASLRRAAVFANRFDLEAAEQVIADEELVSDDILDLLARLVDKSLVVARENDTGEKDFHLLDSIRQYALDHWRQPSLAHEADATRRRHFAYYVGLARETERHLNGPDQARWLNRVDANRDNFRAALAWSHGTPDMAQSALELAALLAMFAYRRGAFTEAREQLAVASARWTDNDAVRAKALRWGGVLAGQQGDRGAAQSMLEESLALYHAVGDKAGAAIVLGSLGRLAGRYGDYEVARACHEESLTLSRELGAERDSAITLSNLGYVASAQGDYNAAHTFYEESLALHRRLGDAWGAAGALLGLGEVARLQDRYELAEEYYRASLAAFREVGDLGGIAMVQHNLGYVALHAGNLTAARRAFQESLSTSVEGQQTDMVAFCLAGLAAVALADGDTRRTGRLFGATDAMLKANGIAFAPADQLVYEQNVARWRADVGETDGEAAWMSGQRLSMQAAVDLALEPAEDAAETQETLVDVSSHPAPQMVERPEPLLRLVALGIARVTRDDRNLSTADGLTGKGKELLFYLASCDVQPMQQIGIDLWPDASRQQLRTLFHNTLHGLRQALGAREWIVNGKQGYALNRDMGVWYDVEEFRALAKSAKGSMSNSETQERQMRDALSLYHGDFLADLDAAWVSPLRVELRLLYRDVALALGRLLAHNDRPAEAADVYRTLIARDSYLEEAYRELMRCLSRCGERAQALRAYQALVQSLEREMGVLPAPETRRVAEQIRQGEDV